MSNGPKAGGGPPDRDHWRLREGLILAAYLALTAVGVLTVLVPELRDEPGRQPEEEGASEGAPDAGQ